MNGLNHIPQDYLHTYNGPNGLVGVKYSRIAQFKRVWNNYPALRGARGHVFDANGEIVARPFDKFFNWQETDLCEIDWSKPYRLYEKLDGFLLVVYYYDNCWRVNSSGSFDSIYSRWGEKMIFNNAFLDRADKNLTYCFEGLWCENRIVLSYNEDKVVLLGARNTKTGEHVLVENLDMSDLFETAKNYSNIPKDELLAMDVVGREGFIVYQNGKPVGKVKFDNYVELHSVITQISHRKIWEAWVDGNLNDFIQMIPDEADQFVKEYLTELETMQNDIYRGVAYCMLQIKEANIESAEVGRFLHELNNPYSKLAYAVWKSANNATNNRVYSLVKKLTYPADQKLFT